MLSHDFLKSVAAVMTRWYKEVWNGEKKKKKLTFVDGINNVGVRGENFSAIFAKGSPGMVSYVYADVQEMLKSVLAFPISGEHRWTTIWEMRWFNAMRSGIAQAQMGVSGNDSWGAKVHPEYLLDVTGRKEFRFLVPGM